MPRAKRFARNSEVEAAPLLQEVILYNPAASNFCVLNSTAARIWEGLERPAGAEDLCEMLRRDFAVTQTDAVERDVDAALQQLQELGLVTSSE